MDPSSPPVITVLGAGAFGTALAHVATYEGRNLVKIWARDATAVNEINTKRMNPKVYTDYVYNDKISATTDLKEAFANTTMILSCLPVQITPQFVRDNMSILPTNVPFVCCSKGMVISERKFISEIVNEISGGKLRYAMLSGPSFAEEMIKSHITCVVVASIHEEDARWVQERLTNMFFRVYTQGDVIGVEIAGALKNVVAIGAGIVEGAGFGYNSMAALITRGTREMQRFALKYGAQPGTMSGLSGIGDVMLTAFGKLSRNMTVGTRLGKGEKLDDILKSSKGVVEGIPTLKAVYDYAAAQNMDLPIITAIHSIVYDGTSINDAIYGLMSRMPEPEFFIVQDIQQISLRNILQSISHIHNIVVITLIDVSVI
eukprot:TRINITY_DN1771_c0_g1_i1.p1 TRINITY_DN1771_c0_g1~~TRINITY_DN1771_c0_g1_i1.p1  ORF type:complete len:373 (+),score=48.07 TRINITY_DN1771_c0_g1_i1:950-2068(+)